MIRFITTKQVSYMSERVIILSQWNHKTTKSQYIDDIDI